MTDISKYEGNGDYYEGSGSSDFKRKSENRSERDSRGEGDETTAPIDKANEYVRELLAEKLNLDHKWPHSLRLIEQEVSRVQTEGKVPHRESKYVDIYREKPIKVAVKVLVPVREHPKFNFVGKLLGPKGNSMKRLQEVTMCKMAVLGRGSMKDRQKEEELRASLDPKYAHLGDDLHVEISALGPPAEAHARIAYALAEVRKYLIPDNNDTIRQEQMREMMTEPVPPSEDSSSSRGTYRRAVPSSRGGLLSRGSVHPPSSTRSLTHIPSHGAHLGAGPRSPVSTPRVMPAKTKILSILDRARAAMEESYGYEDPTLYETSYVATEPYTYAPPTSRSRYAAAPEYEAEYHGEYYRRPEYDEDASSARWKYSSSKSRTEEAGGSSSRHSSSRESRYRSSPYTRPSK